MRRRRVMGVLCSAAWAAQAPRWAAAAVIALGAGLCLALNWPGHFSYDSVVQLAEGKARAYSGEHPPVMSWMLGLADALRPGAAPFVVFDVALVYGALAGVLLVARRVSWLAAPLAAGLVVTPQLLIYPAIVWKDVLFAGAAAAGFAAMAWAARAWARPAQRAALLALALALLAIAALARENGAVVLPFAALALGWIAARRGARWPQALAIGLGSLAAAALVVAAGAAALATRLDTPNPQAQAWEGLESYDIVAAAARDPSLDLAVLHRRAPWLERVVRTEGVAAFSPERVDTLGPVFAPYADRPGVADLIFAQWRGLVVRHPWLYLEVRASAFRWVAMSPRPLDCVLLETGVDGPPQELAESGLAERRTERDQALAVYALGFAGSPVFSHAAYGAAGILLLAWLLRRRRAPDIAVAGLLAAAFAFAASFAVISIACDYRYLYPLDLAVAVAALYAAATFSAGAFPRPGH